jgi:hypothetical protein
MEQPAAAAAPDSELQRLQTELQHVRFAVVYRGLLFQQIKTENEGLKQEKTKMLMEKLAKDGEVSIVRGKMSKVRLT